MKTITIKDFEYIIREDDEVIGIICRNKKESTFILKPRNDRHKSN